LSFCKTALENDEQQTNKQTTTIPFIRSDSDLNLTAALIYSFGVAISNANANVYRFIQNVFLIFITKFKQNCIKNDNQNKPKQQTIRH